jgi:hypothetical protein
MTSTCVELAVEASGSRSVSRQRTAGLFISLAEPTNLQQEARVYCGQGSGMDMCSLAICVLIRQRLPPHSK